MTQNRKEMQATVTKQKLDKYFAITKEALEAAKGSGNRRKEFQSERADFIDMIERYVSDAGHFESNSDYINAFAALNYAHGWLDAGARLGLFDVHDSRLFTVD